MSRDRERLSPRISVNKLGEYLECGVLRRRAIVRDQREPKDFIVPRYTPAQEAIQRYFTTGGDASVIRNAARAIRREPAVSEFDQQRNRLCAEALEAFLKITNEIEFDGVETRKGQDKTPQLSIAGVSVSVRPEVIVRQRDADRTRVGAVKLYLSKTHPLSTEAGQYVATLVHRWVTERIGTRGFADPSLCLVIDVFQGQLIVAPNAFRRRMVAIEAACEEIASKWAA